MRRQYIWLYAQVITSKFSHPVAGLSWHTFITAALIQHQIALAVRQFGVEALVRYHHTELVVFDRLHEDVFNARAGARKRFDKIYLVAIARFREYARRDGRQILTAVEHLSIHVFLLQRPRDDRQIDQRNRKHHRQGKIQYRLDPVRQTQSGTEPHHHFTFAIGARQAHDHCDKQRQR